MLSPELRAKISSQGRGQVVETPLSAEDAANPVKSLWSKFTDRFQVGKEFVTYLPASEAHPHPSGLKYRDPAPGSQPTAAVPSHYPELDYDISFYNRKQKQLTGYSAEDLAYNYDDNGIPRHVDRPAWVDDEKSLAFIKEHYRSTSEFSASKTGLPLMGHYTNDDKDFAVINPDVYHKQDYGNGLFEDVENTQKRAQDIADKYDDLRYEAWDEWVFSDEAKAAREEQVKKNALYFMRWDTEQSASALKHLCRRCVNPKNRKSIASELGTLSESNLRSHCEQWGLSAEGEKSKLVERLIDNLPKLSMKQWKMPSEEQLLKLAALGAIDQNTATFQRIGK